MRSRLTTSFNSTKIRGIIDLAPFSLIYSFMLLKMKTKLKTKHGGGNDCKRGIFRD